MNLLAILRLKVDESQRRFCILNKAGVTLAFVGFGVVEKRQSRKSAFWGKMQELWGFGEARFPKGAIRDDRLEQLQAEFSQSSRRTAELKVERDDAQGKIVRGSVPHDILIERAAHELGLSRGVFFDRVRPTPLFLLRKRFPGRVGITILGQAGGTTLEQSEGPGAFGDPALPVGQGLTTNPH